MQFCLISSQNLHFLISAELNPWLSYDVVGFEELILKPVTSRVVVELVLRDLNTPTGMNEPGFCCISEIWPHGGGVLRVFPLHFSYSLL